MSLNGVWSLEIAGIYGWERISTVFLEDGRYLGGGASHFSQGRYSVKGKKIKFKLHMIQHGDKRTVFGAKKLNVFTDIKAKRKGNVIRGKAKLKDSRSNIPEYTVKLVRKADLIPVKE